jgi:hypothetical protein
LAIKGIYIHFPSFPLESIKKRAKACKNIAFTGFSFRFYSFLPGGSVVKSWPAPFLEELLMSIDRLGASMTLCCPNWYIVALTKN